MSIPCRECITFAICKQKENITCVIVDDYAFLHDHDPGNRGAKARTEVIGQELFGTDNYSSWINPIKRTVLIASLGGYSNEGTM